MYSSREILLMPQQTKWPFVAGLIEDCSECKLYPLIYAYHCKWFELVAYHCKWFELVAYHCKWFEPRSYRLITSTD